jgi:hypothetical protein
MPISGVFSNGSTENKIAISPHTRQRQFGRYLLGQNDKVQSMESWAVYIADDEISTKKTSSRDDNQEKDRQPVDGNPPAKKEMSAAKTVKSIRKSQVRLEEENISRPKPKSSSSPNSQLHISQ